MENQIQLTALSKEEFLKLFRRFGAQLVSEDALQQDVTNGAPVNPDGTFNFVAYAAWLMQQRSEDNND